MNQYQVICPIGEGAHGIVLKGRSTINGETVALKKVALKKFAEDGLPIAVIREIKALQCVEHENIVHLIDVFPQGLSFVMVFDFMPSNLWEVLNTFRLNGSQIKCFTLMLLKGLRYLHQHHIMHRDLKPANLLISHQKILKIADFGLCRLFFEQDRSNKVQYSHQVATRWYRAPELLYGARFYTEAVDIWAAGCIVAEMLKGQPLFPGENDIDQLFKVISSLGTPDETSWPGRSDLPDYNKITFQAMIGVPFNTLVSSDVPGATEFMNKFLLYDASKRITAKLAMEDEFFKQQPVSCSVQALPPLPPPKHVHFEDFDSLYDDSILGNNPSSSHVSSADISSLGSS